LPECLKLHHSGAARFVTAAVRGTGIAASRYTKDRRQGPELCSACAHWEIFPSLLSVWPCFTAAVARHNSPRKRAMDHSPPCPNHLPAFCPPYELRRQLAGPNSASPRLRKVWKSSPSPA